MSLLRHLTHRPQRGLNIERGRPLTARGRSVLTHAAAAYALVFTVLAAVFLFGLVGISVAGATEDYRPYAWVPRLLVLSSGVLIVGTVVRAFRRWRR